MFELCIRGLPFGSDEKFVKTLLIGGDSDLDRITLTKAGGAAFVIFNQKSRAEEQISILNGFKKRKCALKVDWARPKKEVLKRVGSGRVSDDKSKTVFLGNLDWEWKREEVSEYVDQHCPRGGNINRVTLTKKGAAFILTDSESTARRLVERLEGSTFRQRTLRANVAARQTPKTYTN